MVADRIGGEHSWLYVMTGGDRFVVSAAEVFVFLSGLVLGLISAGVIARQALAVALLKALQRVRTLYLLTVTLILMFAALSRQLGLWWAPPVTVATWPDFILSVLTPHRTYFLIDVLLLDTLLFLGTVPMLVLLAHGYTRVVLAGSWGLWALWQLVPQHAVFPWPIADNRVFHVPAWQVLFNTALAIGFHRQHLEERPAHVLPRLVLSLSGVDEDFLLLQCLLQPFFESRQEPSRFLRVGRHHVIDDNGITIGDARHRPKTFVGLGKEGEATELIEEVLLQGLKLLRFNRPAVVVVQRNEEVIFFHRSRLPQGVERWTHGSIR
jgi:hypothetical protein